MEPGGDSTACLTAGWLDGLPADESAEARRVPNLAFTEDSLEPKAR